MSPLRKYNLFNNQSFLPDPRPLTGAAGGATVRLFNAVYSQKYFKKKQVVCCFVVSDQAYLLLALQF